MNLGLEGTRVLVTAGASGIGLATARAFQAEGARVHVCDVDTASLAALASSNPDVGRSQCDVADATAVDRLFETVAASLGGLDVLVNNAGIAGPTARCEDVVLADWERTLAVNLTGQFLCARRAIPLLRASRNASIANLSSAAGRFGFPMRSPYAASKWAVIGFTRVVVDRTRRRRHSRQRDLSGLGCRAADRCRLCEQGAGAWSFSGTGPPGSAGEDVARSIDRTRGHRARHCLPGLARRRTNFGASDRSRRGRPGSGLMIQVIPLCWRGQESLSVSGFQLHVRIADYLA